MWIHGCSVGPLDGALLPWPEGDGQILYVERLIAGSATLRTTLSYVASDVVGQLLKWAVGRHRPSDGGTARRFHPWSGEHEWHSFPSGHVFQIFAIAAVAADETDRPWVGVTGYVLAGLTGLERIYQNDHWASDVVAGAVIAISTGLTVDRWIRRNGLGSIIRPRQPPDP